jgi:dihydropteroate synthase
MHGFENGHCPIDPVLRGLTTEKVAAFLTERRDTLVAAGISADRIVLDPGIGFGKTAAQNMELIHGTKMLNASGQPLLYGISRKRFLDTLTGIDHSADPKRRLGATLAVTLFLASQGVQIFRMHDVAATKQALDVFWQFRQDGRGCGCSDNARQAPPLTS